MTPRLIALVADDLTGATDSAAQFAAAGCPAYLLREPTAQPHLSNAGPAVLAVATDASHDAVHVAHAAMNPAIVYVTLPTVEVIARGHTGEPIAQAGCVKPQRT